MRNFFDIPVPVLAGAALPQNLPPEIFMGGPGWLAALLLGAWIVLWFLDRTNRLPFQQKDSAGVVIPHDGFSDADRKRLEQLFHLFLFRGDEDGIERFPKFMQESRAMDARVVELLTETNLKLERLINAMEKKNE